MLARRHAQRRAQTRRGFTLIELLVVISIIATLAALILPAVQNARATARRTECLNHIRNCGIAAQSYSTARNGNIPLVLDAKIPVTWDDGSGVVKSASPWTVQLMPYMEQGPLAERLAVSLGVAAQAPNDTFTLSNTVLQVFNCPDDQNSDAPGNLSYAINNGYELLPIWGQNSQAHVPENYDYAFNGATGVSADDTEVARATGPSWSNAFVNTSTGALESGPQSAVKIDKVSSADGTNSTLLFSENLQSLRWIGRQASAADTTAFVSFSGLTFSVPVPGAATTALTVTDNSLPNGVGTAGTGSKGTGLTLTTPYVVLMGGKINDLLQTAIEGQTPRPSSLHVGGANVVYVGGNGGFMSQSIDGKVYAQLITWDGSRKGQDILSDSDF